MEAAGRDVPPFQTHSARWKWAEAASLPEVSKSAWSSKAFGHQNSNTNLKAYKQQFRSFSQDGFLFTCKWWFSIFFINVLSSVQLFAATPWTIAHEAPLSMGFPRQEYWSGLPLPSLDNLPYLVAEPISPLASRFFFTKKPENPITIPPKSLWVAFCKSNKIF